MAELDKERLDELKRMAEALVGGMRPPDHQAYAEKIAKVMAYAEEQGIETVLLVSKLPNNDSDPESGGLECMTLNAKVMKSMPARYRSIFIHGLAAYIHKELTDMAERNSPQ